MVGANGLNRVPANAPLHLLPGVLRQIADVCGVNVAVRLAETCGGTPLWVPSPKNLTADHPLVALVGPDAAAQLAALFQQGQMIPIPKAHAAALRVRNAQIVHEHYVLGISQIALARRWWLTDRQIRTIVNGTALEVERVQEDLFGTV